MWKHELCMECRRFSKYTNNLSVFNFSYSLSTKLQKKNQIFTLLLPAAFPHSKLDCGTWYHTPTLYCNFFCSESIVVTVFASYLFNIFSTIYSLWVFFCSNCLWPFISFRFVILLGCGKHWYKMCVFIIRLTRSFLAVF